MSAASYETWTCLECSQSARVAMPVEDRRCRVLCPRCRAEIRRRKPGSLSHTWALVISAGLLYLPANIYPFLNIKILANRESSTILAGIEQLFSSGMWGVAIIIFFINLCRRGEINKREERSECARGSLIRYKIRGHRLETASGRY